VSGQPSNVGYPSRPFKVEGSTAGAAEDPEALPRQWQQGDRVLRTLRPLGLLLLEESQDEARLILHDLRRAGFEPVGDRVETESEFLGRLDPAPDLILADYHLPQFDALRALRLVRERDLDVPIIVVTGALGDEAAVECLKQGACDYLLKDRLARLGQAVAHALDQKQSRDDQRRTAAALHESEARKSAILETAVDGIITINERGTVESFNPAAEHMFGYLAGEVIGRNVTMLMPSPYQEEHVRCLDSYLTTGRAKIMGTGREVVGCKNDGTTFPMELAVSEVRLGDRRIFSGIVRDISERKRAQLELERRTRELARSNVELEQFAYVASHDLQEPLRMIGSFTQLLARRYGGQLNATADEFISYIVDGVVRMQALINDLLAYSRVGTRGATFQPTDCEAVVERALINLKPAIDETAAVVTHDPLPSLWADAAQLVPLFQNLIGNAIKYRGEGPPRIHIAAERQGEGWVFSIRDHGIGFDPKYAERIFIIFQRLHTPDQYPGTGIGLAICKKIIDRHAGRIWAESEPGRGSRFCFTIPAKADGEP
jgi:PAS domain S-box-containing protein